MGLLKSPMPTDGVGSSANGAVPPILSHDVVSPYDQGYSSESVAARRQLRGDLRNVSAAESGLKIQGLAVGTFGFSHSLLFRYEDFDVQRAPNGRLSFEVHNVRPNEVYAVAFVNADAQRKLLLHDGELSEPVTLYSDMWQDARYGVRVKVSTCKGEGRMITLDDGKTVTAVDCVPRKHK